MIRTALAQLDDEEDWVALGRVGQRLAILFPDFDSRTYGQSKLSSLAERTNAFELRQGDSGHLQIRAKRPARKK